MDSASRDGRIDVLRLVGLLAIILAHSGASGLLFQLRNFDVPLMVMISAMSFWLSHDSSHSYWEYVSKRIQRLVFPVWIFLVGYFSFVYIFDSESDILNVKTFATSVLLVSGIGYVWVIRIFLIVSLVAPLIHIIYFRFGSKVLNIYSLMFAFVIVEIVRFVALPYLNDGIWKALSLVFLYGASYVVVFCVGLYVFLSGYKRIASMIAVFFIIFLSVEIWSLLNTGTLARTQDFKYPPSVFYFSYSIIISGMLWIAMGKFPELISKFSTLPLVTFMASNSIWIYLWHIPFVEYIDAPYYIKYCYAVIFPVLIVYLQVASVNYAVKYISDNRIARVVCRVLTG